MIFALTAFLLIIAGSLFKLNHTDFYFLNGNNLLIPGIVFHSIALLVVLYDLIVNPVRNKFMWLIGIFTISSITVIFYLFNRDHHLKRDFNPEFNEY